MANIATKSGRYSRFCRYGNLQINYADQVVTARPMEMDGGSPRRNAHNNVFYWVHWCLDGQHWTRGNSWGSIQWRQ